MFLFLFPHLLISISRVSKDDTLSFLSFFSVFLSFLPLFSISRRERLTRPKDTTVLSFTISSFFLLRAKSSYSLSLYVKDSTKHTSFDLENSKQGSDEAKMVAKKEGQRKDAAKIESLSLGIKKKERCKVYDWRRRENRWWFMRSVVSSWTRVQNHWSSKEKTHCAHALVQSMGGTRTQNKKYTDIKRGIQEVEVRSHSKRRTKHPSCKFFQRKSMLCQRKDQLSK